MASVDLRGVSKRFGATEVLRPSNLSVEDGEFLVIMGPSGCGKSTLLRLIAGLETPSSGRIMIDDRDVTDVAAAQRGLAMVFQSYALYPHLTVAENIAFPLRVAGVPKPERQERVAAVAKQLELSELLSRKSAALSGGQRQRVSIARALIKEPGIILLDEPLSNLDAELRVRMRHEFARLHARLGATMIYVTHDQLEAMTLANRIVVMSDGRIEQIGAPIELYERPANLVVARAIGAPGMNLLRGTIEGAEGGAATIRLGDGQRIAARADLSTLGDRSVTVGVRPEDLEPDAGGPFSGRVELFERLGPMSFVHLGDPGKASTIVARLPSEQRVTLGETMTFAAPPSAVFLFDAEGTALPRLSP